MFVIPTIHRPRSNSTQEKYQLILMEGAPKVGQKDKLINRTENLKNSISGFAMLLLWPTSNNQPNQTQNQTQMQWCLCKSNGMEVKNSKCINGTKARPRFTLNLRWMIYSCALTLTDVIHAEAVIQFVIIDFI